MSEEFFLEYMKLKNSRETFATAMVVQHGNPISGKTGDKAIILAEGSIHGWIGGGCTHPIVIEVALSVIASGTSKLITIDPKTQYAQGADEQHFYMNCHSGGSLTVYIEPVSPKPLVVVLGDSPVGQSLLRLSADLDYETIWLSESHPAEVSKNGMKVTNGFDLESFNLENPCFLVVCTQGEGDLEALRAAIKTSLPYQAFVGSRKKMDAMKKELVDDGVCSRKLSKLVNPAGLDLNARTPAEIALSILAEIVTHLRTEQPNKSIKSPDNEEKTLDPVCGMEVGITETKHVSLLDGQNYYFCCKKCMTLFEKSPKNFLITS